jgi:hypothetical protein
MLLASFAERTSKLLKPSTSTHVPTSAGHSNMMFMNSRPEKRS